MVKVTAKGKVNGRDITLTCTKSGDTVKLYKDGKELKDTDEIKMALYDYTLRRNADYEKAPCAYNPQEGTIEAYWLAFHETFFDEPPKIEVEGDLDTFGAPYSDEDTSQVVF